MRAAADLFWWHPRLEPVISDIARHSWAPRSVYRDGNVAKYGLGERAAAGFDTILLEVVAPFRPGTAAGRFIDKTGGRGRPTIGRSSAATIPMSAARMPTASAWPPRPERD